MDDTRVRQGDGLTMQVIFAPTVGGEEGYVKAKDGRAYFCTKTGQLTRPSRLRGKAAVKARKRARHRV